MTQSPIKPMTFEAYLNYDDGSENKYELIDGVLIALPPESGRNNQIIAYLFLAIVQVVGFKYVRSQNTEIQVRGNPQNRWPDIVILDDSHPAQLHKRSTITLGMMPPVLVLEVVSPGKRNQQRDYQDKLIQYQDRQIPEYWIVDPDARKVTVFVLDESGQYTSASVYQGMQALQSSVLPQLSLTAEDIITAGD